MGDDAREGEAMEHAAVEGWGKVLVAGEGMGVVLAAVDGGDKMLVVREGEGVVHVTSGMASAAVEGGG